MLTRHNRDIMKLPKSLDENFHRISEAKIYNSQPVFLHLFWNTFKDLNNCQSQPLSRFPTHPRLASRGWRRRCQEFESIQRWFESKKSALWTWSFLWTGPPGICKEEYFIMMWSKDRSAERPPWKWFHYSRHRRAYNHQRHCTGSQKPLKVFASYHDPKSFNI